MRSRATMALCALSTATMLLGAHFTAPAAAGTTPSARTVAPAIALHLADQTVRYGDAVIATGRVRGADRAGRELLLESRAHDGAWAVVARTRTQTDGRFRVSARIPRSGLVRVTAVPAAGAAATAGTGGVPAVEASRERGVRVALRVAVTHRHTSVNTGGSVRVAGTVSPRRSGRLVLLQSRTHGAWHTLARARTRKGGSYRLTHRVRSAGSARLRVRTAGTPALAAGTRSAGRLTAFRPTLASWYGGGQSLACGGSLTPGMMGVAHKSLPCGTMVTIRYHGRQVRVPVVDRGPYSGNREFDLGPGVRSALHFDGVGTIWVSVR